MAINYPSSFDGTLQFGQPSGTNLLTSPDHGVLHTNLSLLGTVLENVLGTTPGTGVLRQISSASDYALIANTGGTLITPLSKGTINNGILGTPAITGGTYNNGILGTPAITGGTYNNATLGTPTILGLTLSGGLQVGTQTTTIGTNSISGTAYADMISTPLITTGTVNILSMISVIWYNPGTSQSFGVITLDGTVLGNDPCLQFDSNIGVSSKAITAAAQAYFSGVAAGTHTLTFRGRVAQANGAVTLNSGILTGLAYNK